MIFQNEFEIQICKNDDLPSDLMSHSLKIWNLPVTNELSYCRLEIQNPHWVITGSFSRFFPFGFPLDHPLQPHVFLSQPPHEIPS